MSVCLSVCSNESDWSSTKQTIRLVKKFEKYKINAKNALSRAMSFHKIAVMIKMSCKTDVRKEFIKTVSKM